MPLMQPRPHARSALRRHRIMEAALACFTAAGTAEARVPDIGRAAGASIGSIYHQFGSKEGLAAAVYLEGLRRYQQGLVATLENVTEAQAGILAVVNYHLTWAETNERWARYLLEARRADFMAGYEEDIQALNRAFGQALGAWLRPHVLAGRIRTLPLDLYPALLLGPCHEYVRGRLGGRAVTPREEAEALLGEAAWRALAGERAAEGGSDDASRAPHGG